MKQRANESCAQRHMNFPDDMADVAREATGERELRAKAEWELRPCTQPTLILLLLPHLIRLLLLWPLLLEFLVLLHLPSSSSSYSSYSSSSSSSSPTSSPPPPPPPPPQYPPLPPWVCLRIHTEGEARSDLGRVLVFNDPPARAARRAPAAGPQPVPWWGGAS